MRAGIFSPGGSFSRITGDVFVDGGAGNNQIVITDTFGEGNTDVIVTDSLISGIAPGVISYVATDGSFGQPGGLSNTNAGLWLWGINDASGTEKFTVESLGQENTLTIPGEDGELQY